jgi:hypothetical protein
MENSKTEILISSNPPLNKEISVNSINTQSKTKPAEPIIPFEKYLELTLKQKDQPEKNIEEEFDINDWIDSLSGQIPSFNLLTAPIIEPKNPLIYTDNSKLYLSEEQDDHIQLNINSQNSSLNLKMPAGEPIEQLSIQYDASNSSITAQIIGSAQATQILNSQLQTLKDNLAKYNIKIKSLKIQSVQSQNNNSKEKNKNSK